MTNSTLTAVRGIRVGHQTDAAGATGCTVILCPPGTVGGVDQRGGAPGTRETDLLRPMHLVQHVNAIVLAGGSAYGLAAADGVMRYLEECDTGFPCGDGLVVPIVPAAILFDLDIGDPHARPDTAMGHAACKAASGAPVEQGCVGAGTGCRVGTLLGLERATKGGLGSARLDAGALIVTAIVAVNCVGDIVDADGTILAGLRDEDGTRYAGTLETMMSFQQFRASVTGHTVIGAVVTNAALDKDGANKVAQMAHDGLARAARPAHTIYDGDTLFALATGDVEADVSLVGALAADVVATSIRAGVRAATTLAGLRAWNDWPVPLAP